MAFTRQSMREKLNTDCLSALSAGIVCAWLLNPWDRALYLALQNNRRLLHKENFSHPYQGATQAIFQRAFIGSIYYFLQGELNCYLAPYLRTQHYYSETAAQFWVGLFSGAISGLIGNSFATIKYWTWSQNHSFLKSVRLMHHQGGIQPFLKGTQATIWRDSVFGVFYEMGRHKLQSQLTNDDPPSFRIAANACAGVIASIAASPFNYARLQQYSTPPQQKPLPTHTLLRTLFQETLQVRPPRKALSFFSKKCQIASGSARIAVGVSLSQCVFNNMQKTLDTSLSSPCP